MAYETHNNVKSPANAETPPLVVASPEEYSRSWYIVESTLFTKFLLHKYALIRIGSPFIQNCS